MKQKIRNIHRVVVHCAATPPSHDIGAYEINQWHLSRGWRMIGYHFVVRRNGVLETGRMIDVMPAANGKGLNHNTVAICYVGGLHEVTREPEDNRTREQITTLKSLRKVLDVVLNDPEWVGHRDLSPDLNNDGKITSDEWLKDCPCFDVKTEY